MRGVLAAEEPLEVTAGSAHEALIQAGCGCSGDAEALKSRGDQRGSVRSVEWSVAEQRAIRRPGAQFRSG